MYSRHKFFNSSGPSSSSSVMKNCLQQSSNQDRLETEIGPEFQFCNDLHDDKHECPSANFRIPTNPASRSSSRIVTRHRIFSLGPSASSVMKYCPLSTVFKPGLEHSFDNFWSSDSCSNCCSCSCNKFHRRCSSVRGSALVGSVGISIDSKGSCASGFTEAMVSLDTSLHISATAP